MLALGALIALAVLLGWMVFLIRRLGYAPHWQDVVGEKARWLRYGSIALIVGGTATMVAAEVLQRTSDPARWRPVMVVGLGWIAFVFYLTLALAVVALACLVARLVRRPGARMRIARVGAGAAVLLAGSLTAYGTVEAGDVATSEHTVAIENLGSGLDGMRVAFVSDLHVGPIRDASFTRQIVEQVNAAEPDLIVLGGDYSDGLQEHVGAYLDPLGDLDAPFGVVAVSGNHEFIGGEAEETLQRLESLGIDVLRNTSVVLERDGARLVVAGVHDAAGTGADAPDPEAALAGTSPEDPLLFVAHEPSQFVADAGIDLQLSGHTHGGQLWPFGYAVRLDQPTVAGLDEVDGVPILTGRGAGAWGPAVRVGAPPEVLLVTLRAA